ncbi:11364_t:CDS:2 [Dentiscutata heterogama]|uniref:11364_t:CDS:1 n=1 Tax=Dentiscutata heterogama TaxID=1316150 RepID=A0ACA9LNW9_9GLOM|nr:11364_t:CDS:2 [Dentiscutata heterogama]
MSYNTGRRLRTIIFILSTFCLLYLTLVFLSFPFLSPDENKNDLIILPPLPPPSISYWSISQWPSDIRYVPCIPKIYVYKIPENLKSQSYYEYEICKGSNYNVEVTLYEQLIKSGKINDLYVTSNPDEADFFFIPFFGSCYLMNCWNTNNWDYTKRCEIEEKYSIPLMNWVIKENPYWNKTNGRNHIMIHPMDRGSLYYPESQIFMLNASFLTVIGDKRISGFREHRYRHMQDIVIPSVTRILNVAKINPRDYVDADGNRNNRDVFAMFWGCCQNVKPDDEYSLGIRSILFSGLAKSPRYKIDEEVNHTHEDYAKLLTRAKFGLAPQGWTLDTTRLWEYLAFGVVPVIIADGIVLPFENDVDWKSMAVFIRREDVHLTDEILLSITENEYQRKRQRVWEIGSQLYKNSWHYIARDLCRKLDRVVPTELDL